MRTVTDSVELWLDFPMCANAAPEAKLRACAREAAEAAIELVGPKDLEAVVLTGTLARGEAVALVRSDGSLLSLSDLELLLICRSREVQRRSWPKLSACAQELEEAFRGRGITLEVDLRPTLSRDLRRLRRRIFTLELRTHGKVLWGRRDSLECVPQVRPERLLRWDAVTLLFNRIIEHLDARRTIASASPEELAMIQYKNGKILLDLAGSLLAFCGQYEPTYRARADKFPALFATLAPLNERVPDLPEQVRRWTDFRMTPDEAMLTGGGAPGDTARLVREQWHRTGRAVREVWLWESNRFLGGPLTDDPYALASRYLKTDMMGVKVKGWLQLLIHARGRREVTLGRALRLMSLARPNTLIYVAGAILYFALSQDNGRERARQLEEAAVAADRFLPVPAEDWDDPREVVAAVVRNWEWFVK